MLSVVRVYCTMLELCNVNSCVVKWRVLLCCSIANIAIQKVGVCFCVSAAAIGECIISVVVYLSIPSIVHSRLGLS